MTSTLKTFDLLDMMKGDPVSKFLADGGTWADAIALQYSLQLPLWEGQLKGAVGRKGPSAERHKARLMQHLQEAYNYMGQTGKAERQLAAFQAEWEEEQAAKANTKAKAALPKAAAKPKPKGTNAWEVLAASDSE